MSPRFQQFTNDELCEAVLARLRHAESLDEFVKIRVFSDNEVRNVLEEATVALQDSWLLKRPPEIYRDPAWLPTLPALQNRIQIRVAYDEEGQ